MKKRAILMIPFLFALSLGYLYASEQPEKIEKVIVTGIGIDADKARQNAIRNAVEQVIGTFVKSESIVENSQIIKDEVLSYSGGFLQESHIISQEKNDDGLFTVKLEAQVVATKLKRKIESLNIATKKVENEGLFEEAFSKIENQQAGQELLDKLLSKYPQAAYAFEIEKPQILSTDHDNGRAKIRIPVTVKWDKDFLSELNNVLSQISMIDLKSVDIVSFEKGANSKYLQGNKAICITGKGYLRSGKASVCKIIGIAGGEGKTEKAFSKEKKSQSFSLANLFTENKQSEDRGRMQNALRFTFRQYSLFNQTGSRTAKGLKLSLSFKNRGGENIDSAIYNFENITDNDGLNRQGIRIGTADSRTFALKSALENGFFIPPNTLWNTGGHILILTDGIYKISPEVSVDMNILKDISSIDVHMESWIDN